MTKEKNAMKPEDQKNQEQLNTEETQQQTQQNKEKSAQEKMKKKNQKENEQTRKKGVKKDSAQKKEKSKKEEDEKGTEEKVTFKEEKAKDKEQEEKPAEKEKEESTEKKSDKEKLAELQDKYLRLTAEYDNYRKRTLKEKMELTKSAGEDILKGLLPIMDDFERALQSIDESGENQAVKDGIYLIYNKFKEYLKQQGVQEIEAEDKEFDTDKHEAISKVPAPSEDMKGMVVDVVQKGYYLNDKVLRFAKVVVGE